MQYANVFPWPIKARSGRCDYGRRITKAIFKHSGFTLPSPFSSLTRREILHPLYVFSTYLSDFQTTTAQKPPNEKNITLHFAFTAICPPPQGLLLRHST